MEGCRDCGTEDSGRFNRSHYVCDDCVERRRIANVAIQRDDDLFDALMAHNEGRTESRDIYLARAGASLTELRAYADRIAV